jgi:glutamyl endopeptidase
MEAVMIKLKSVSKPESPFEAFEAAAAPSREITGSSLGMATSEVSRSLLHLAVKGKGGPIRPPSPFESVINTDERVRILDTDLSPWRMICALRLHGPGGAGAIGTGWFIGPKTLITAGHCVFSNYFFGGWASTIELIPGLNGNGPNAQPYDCVMSTRFSSTDRWVENEDADFDIGCIHLDTDKGSEVGWFAIGALPSEELESYLVNISGYPADRGAGTEQYFSKNRVLKVSERRLFYEVDTYGGQSGALVWIYEQEGAAPLAVGVHAYGTGGTPTNFGITANSAPRIIPEVLEKMKEWVEEDGGWPAA